MDSVTASRQRRISGWLVVMLWAVTAVLCYAGAGGFISEHLAGTHCFAHCGACLDSCPESLRIPDVLRYRMYFENYGDEKDAMRLYAGLEKQANVCIGCSAPCRDACPEGIPIRERTIGAHRMLTFA